MEGNYCNSQFLRRMLRQRPAERTTRARQVLLLQWESRYVTNISDSTFLSVYSHPKGVVSAKVSVSPVRNLDPRLLSANLKEAVQRLLIEKSSLALIGETPSLLLQYQAHKDQLKLLPDVVSSSYFAFGVKRGTSFEPISAISEFPAYSRLQNPFGMEFT